MNRAALYAHAIRAARRRQLVARATRPVRRRLGHSGPPPQPVRPLPQAVELWRSPAFAAVAPSGGFLDVLGRRVLYPPPDWSVSGLERLRRFHLHYGEEVLALARAGEMSAARSAIASWIAGNPARRGDGWHPYTISTRAGNWIAASTLLPGLLDDEASKSLWSQLRYLARNVEDEILGNHVVRNARGLILGGAAFESAALLDRGRALLRRELPEQVLADGGHYERSPVYHLLVLRDLLEVRAAAGLDELDEVIDRMRRFAAALTRPDGHPALFNDGTLDLAPRLDLPPGPDGLAVFADSGYVVLRRSRLWLAFDCGPVAPPFLPAHAHADALSFQLWVDGRPVVVDPGTPTYEPGPERDRCRSSDVHSTVTIRGSKQFIPWGAFRAGPLPQVRLLRTEPLEAEARYGGRRHVRRITVEDRELRIEDVVDGPTGTFAQVRVAVQFAPGAETALIDAAGSPVRRENGTISERLYERIPAARLVIDRAGSLPLATEWRIAVGGT